MMPVSGETSLATIQSAPLALRLLPGVLDHVLGLGGKADHQRRPAPGPLGGDGLEDVGVLDQLQPRRRALPALLDLLRRLRRRRASRRRRRRRRRCRRAAPPRTAASISRAVSTRTTSTPGGSRHAASGRVTSVTRAPSAARLRGDRGALLAGGAVGDVAHRIDRLVRRPAGDEHVAAGERALHGARCGSRLPMAFGDLTAARGGGGGRPAAPRSPSTSSGTSASRPGPASPRSAISPTLGPDEMHAVGLAAARRCAGWPDAATCAGSWPAPPAPACRSPSARTRRDRRRGRPPSWPAGRRWPAPPRSASASRERRMWPISRSSSRSNSSVNTRSLVSAPTDSGVMNSCAALVITARTPMPRSRRRRISSRHL